MFRPLRTPAPSPAWPAIHLLGDASAQNRPRDGHHTRTNAGSHAPRTTRARPASHPFASEPRAGQRLHKPRPAPRPVRASPSRTGRTSARPSARTCPATADAGSPSVSLRPHRFPAGRRRLLQRVAQVARRAATRGEESAPWHRLEWSAGTPSDDLRRRRVDDLAARGIGSRARAGNVPHSCAANLRLHRRPRLE